MKAGQLMALAALTAAWLPALGVSLWIASCADASAAAGPTGPEAAVVGEWAAPYPTMPDILVLMSLRADKSYENATKTKGITLQLERGTWLVRASRVVFEPSTCAAIDQAEDLRLIPCKGGDSIAAAAAADTWPVTLTAEGKILELTFRRL